jgi:predicted outer membrane protein
MNTVWFYSLIVLFCVLSTSLLRAQAGFADPSKTSAVDKQFIRETSQNSWIEQQIGFLTQKRSQNDRLRAMGQKMVSDYAQITLELTNIAPALYPSGSTTRNTRTLARLARLSGEAFDQIAVRDLNQYLQQTVRQCDRESMRGENSVIKQFALASLPILQSDLDLGLTLYTDMNNRTGEPSKTATQPLPASRTTD